MIPDNSIKAKDFSIELPVMINRLQFIESSLFYTLTSDSRMQDEYYDGLRGILEDIVNDLKKINDALYPTKGATP